MTMEQLAEALNGFRSKGGIVRPLDRRKPLELESIQNDLKLEFPTEFGAFHQKYEYLQIGSIELLSIGQLVSLYIEMLEGKRLPKTYYFPVLKDEYETYFLISRKQNGKSRNNFGEVVVRLADGEEVNRYHNYTEFVISVIRSCEEFL